MTAEHSPHAVPESADGLPEKPMTLPLDPAGEKSPEDLNSHPELNTSVANGKSTPPARNPEDTALHAMANSGHDEKLDQKSVSPVSSSEAKSESAAPSSDVKTESSLSADRKEGFAEQGPGRGNPDPSVEISGATDGPPRVDATKVESSSPEKQLTSSTQGETEPFASTGQTQEITPQKARNIEKGMQAPEKAGTDVEVAGEHQQPPVPSGVEGESEISTNAGQMEASGPVSGKCPEGAAAETTDPAVENPELLISLPPVKKPWFGTRPSTRIKDAELRGKVVIPHYLSKGMVGAIESAGVAYNDGPRINNVKSPESPILVFINSKSGGRLGPQLEAMLVHLIGPTQVYDLAKCNPVEVLRYGLGHLEKEADEGDEVALAARNNLRIVVAGGDGTVGWVLGAIAGLGVKERFKTPPVGVIPLGTGNDLSRSFRWGGSTSSVSRRGGRRWLTRSIEANIVNLDSWQVVVKPAPTRQNAPLKLPHALLPQHHIPLEDPASGKEAANVAPYFAGSFWNYFSLGMDAQVAYGFHNLRHEAPWLASGRISNQMVYGGYGCVQGWFCTPCATAPIARGTRQIATVNIKRIQGADAPWEELELPADIRAIVILNLQSYAGGRNPWGHPSSKRREKHGFVEAKCDDGVFEIVGFRDGWHTAFVLFDWLSAVRLGQARALKLELRGTARRSEAYMQMDGEPWQQSLGSEGDPPAVVEITCNPIQSLCLVRK